MAPNSRISMVVTSCNRHDLLQQTLESFYAMTDIEPQELIICEDSDAPKPEFLSGDVWRGRNVRWLSNGTRMGQIYSCDRLLSEVKYEYIFWCEDDWDFQQSNFMQESKEILDTHPTVIQVSLRGDTGWHELESGSYGYKIAKPYWHGVWGGWSFNPGLRKTEAVRSLLQGSFGRHVAYGTSGLGHEAQISKMFLDKGFRIADFGRPIVAHTGGSRSRAIEPLPPMPKILIAIPACFAFEYGRWESEESPHYNAAKAWNGVPYGTDIHISRPVNDRIDAIRDTWAKDIEPFKDHVTLKFFYGRPPTGFPRAALADEVFLDCPDDYAGLPLKTVAISNWAYTNNFQWLFKADDDTAVYMDRLVRELMENRFDYAGYTHANVCSGGPGYWLSRRAFILVSQQGDSPDVWAEDVWVGKIMDRNRITPTMLPGHKPGFSAHWWFHEGFDPNKLKGDEVTLHAVAPKEMREWYEHISKDVK